MKAVGLPNGALPRRHKNKIRIYLSVGYEHESKSRIGTASVRRILWKEFSIMCPAWARQPRRCEMEFRLPKPASLSYGEYNTYLRHIGGYSPLKGMSRAFGKGDTEHSTAPCACQNG